MNDGGDDDDDSDESDDNDNFGMTMVTRCTLGEWACTASCVTLGQTSGLCTDEGFLLHSRASMPQSPVLFPTKNNLFTKLSSI